MREDAEPMPILPCVHSTDSIMLSRLTDQMIQLGPELDDKVLTRQNFPGVHIENIWTAWAAAE